MNANEPWRRLRDTRSSKRLQTMMNGTVVAVSRCFTEMDTRVPAVQKASSPVVSHACGT
jgi:hypothetical protein